MYQSQLQVTRTKLKSVAWDRRELVQNYCAINVLFYQSK